MNRFHPPAADVTASDGRSHWVHSVSEDTGGAAHVRGELAGWLQRHFTMNEQRRGDVVLAVNEAMANAVEFGSPNPISPGMVVCTAAYDEHTRTLTVRVTDGGRWRLAATPPPLTPGHCPRRGRGMALMRLLTDELRIDPSEQGTQVTLIWIDLR